MYTLVHVTHEAQEKMGGIGAVLEGLLTARAYQAAVERTILLGCGQVPPETLPATVEEVLYQTGGPAGEGVADGLAAAFRHIEATYGVRLLHARRRVPCPLRQRRSRVELLLFDVSDALPEPINRTKADLWASYGLESDRFEHDWGYEEWVRLAAPALAAVEALVGPALAHAALVSHEFMGLPTLLAARLRVPDLRTIYWAHEVPPVRDLIEREVGHRLVFDRALETEAGAASYQAALRQNGGYKHALVSRAHHASAIFAVSERVAKELALLADPFRRRPIEVAYNGLPVRPITLEERLRSRRRLIRYAKALAGFAPDYVFTHVARAVASKAIERDLAVLEHLDDRLAERGKSAVLFVLATDAGRRDPDTVRHMETAYGWPMHHREGWPDLAGGETSIGRAAQAYNGWARATRVVLINQFGFDRASCGERMSADMRFLDLRQGSDVEFGQSAYEPFGIAPLETLAFGGICVLACACGCADLLRRVADEPLPENILLADYSAPPEAGPAPISEGETRRIEHEVAARLAATLADRLPTSQDDIERLLESGWALAERMSWQAMCRDYIAPALARSFGDRPPARGKRTESR
ncbi:MAG: hypothetical protein ISS74_03965 [Planctomycetes bacterium]|nr:hypothetical protein [Planctomycetota bacterium]